MKDRIEGMKKVIEQVGLDLDETFDSIFQADYDLKLDTSFVTDEDKRAEDTISSWIRKNYPDDGILGEEGTEEVSESGYKWVIDPIDGTSNFIYRLPTYTTTVGLFKDDEVVGGVIYVPAVKQMFHAIKGEGFCTQYGTCKVSGTQNIEESMLMYAIAHKPHLMDFNKTLYPIMLDKFRKIRMFGSVSFEVLQVASGLVDAAISVGPTAWDIAAGVLMVREAHGVVVNFSGDDWKPGDSTMLATSPQLKDEIISLLKENLPDDSFEK